MTALEMFIKESTRFTLLLTKSDNESFAEISNSCKKKEKEQIVHAFDCGNLIDTYSNGKDFYEANYENDSNNKINRMVEK
jgi:hypothetical protein